MLQRLMLSRIPYLVLQHLWLAYIRPSSQAAPVLLLLDLVIFIKGKGVPRAVLAFVLLKQWFLTNGTEFSSFTTIFFG